MIAILPFAITNAMVTSTATAEAAYNAGTTYAEGAVVSVGDDAWVSLQNANTGNTPASSPAWWVKRGLNNKLAMFDASPSSLSTQSPSGTDLVVAIVPGVRTTAVGFAGLVGGTIRVHVKDAPGGATLLDQTRTLTTSDGSYWGWCFEAASQQAETLWFGLPSAPGMQINITITPDANGVAACGLCVLGRERPLGNALYGLGVETELRGTGYLDSDGNPVRPDRGRRKNASATLQVRSGDFDRVSRFLHAQAGVPMYWSVADQGVAYSTTNFFGDFQAVTGQVTGPRHTSIALDIAGYF